MIGIRGGREKTTWVTDRELSWFNKELVVTAKSDTHLYYISVQAERIAF